MNGNNIRRTFLDYFEQRGHRIVPSSPIVPRNDPSLFFTNAGMVQFKEVFTGNERRDYTRATTAQKVMRVSGKHNDLENVGVTPRHHTFFEMLGNFSFGDYFKQDAIRYAWDLLINVYGLDPDTLWITVFREDDDAAQIWIDDVGLPPERVVRMDEADNFWSMGDTGPCGPCSEIHFDRRHAVGPAGVGPDKDPERFLEIWNLVFMQFERQQDGSLLSLPRPSIDTGMGLERIAALLQGKVSNYDTDLFQPIIQRTAELAKVSYGDNADTDTSLRVIADHSRAAAFLIADGIMPSKDSRGYVLRRIMRRAIRHGVKLGFQGPFLYQAVNTVIDQMGEAFPELLNRRDAVEAVVLREEEQFSQTLSNGLRLFRAEADTLRETGNKTLPGEAVFKLYDTYGFPVDLTQVIAEEEGMQVDLEGFQAAMQAQKQRARAAWVGSGEARVSPVYQELAETFGQTNFVGYQKDNETTAVLALLKGGQRVNSASAGDSIEIVVESTPFYGESGGQQGDKGLLTGAEVSEGTRLQVRIDDTQKPIEGLFIHRASVLEGRLEVGAAVRLAVDKATRDATRRNHTATHLLHAALKDVLGTHVAQRGSLVGPDRLRFDFSHFQPVTSEEAQRVEDQVNQAILANLSLEIDERSMDEATRAGVVALFGEKYGERVRVVAVPGVSTELCGGTHVHRTGDIGLFKWISETGIAAGVRRIEAQTGAGALAFVRNQEETLKLSANRLKIQPSEVPARIERLLESHRQLEAEVQRLKAAQIEGGGSTLEDRIVTLAGVKVLAMESQADSPKVLREQADRLRERLESGIVILGARADGKVTLLVAVTPDLSARFSANKLIRALAPYVDGRGGGKDDLAQAGGTNPDGLDAALAHVQTAVEACLG